VEVVRLEKDPGFFAALRMTKSTTFRRPVLVTHSSPYRTRALRFRSGHPNAGYRHPRRGGARDNRGSRAKRNRGLDFGADVLLVGEHADVYVMLFRVAERPPVHREVLELDVGVE